MIPWLQLANRPQSFRGRGRFQRKGNYGFNNSYNTAYLYSGGNQRFQPYSSNRGSKGLKKLSNTKKGPNSHTDFPKRVDLHSNVSTTYSVVGKLKLYTEKWHQITNDPWVLEAISGYKIHFDSPPDQFKIPNEIPFSRDQFLLVDNEVQELLSKGAIVPWESECGEFILTLFIVPKKNGKFRPVINLRYLNQFVHYDHFKQETFKVVLNLIQENDFFTSIDLNDAYFFVPINENYQKYLKFSWRGVLYKFVCLPFGLKSSPYVFTKILKPVYDWFRQQNICCCYYIDDSLNMNADKLACINSTNTIIETLLDLGYAINLNKRAMMALYRSTG